MVEEFIIFGAPARKSNSRIFTGTSFILGKSAQRYINIFEKQIKRINLKNIPYDKNSNNNKNLLWLFEIWYNNKSADASIELVFDLLQEYKIIENDVNIRNYVVLSGDLDYEIPRTKIGIYCTK